MEKIRTGTKVAR